TPSSSVRYGAGVSGTTVFFEACDSTTSGNQNFGFRFVSSISDATSGASSANYPTLSGVSRWTTHSNETPSASGGLSTWSDFLWNASNCGGSIAGTPGNYTITVSDAAGNTATTTLSFTDDHASSGTPTVTGVTLNNGGTLGTIDANDYVEVTYSEAMDPAS